MPLLVNHTHKFAPPPIPFLCGHTTPPSARPTTKLAPNTTSYPHGCLRCDTSTRLTSQSLILDAYNGLIYDQASRLNIANARQGTQEEGRYDREMVEEGERRIRDWRLKRAEEVIDVWKGWEERWAGTGVILRSDGEGGYKVEGLEV